MSSILNQASHPTYPLPSNNPRDANMPLRYDPEYHAAMAPLLAAPKPPPHKTVHELRAHVNAAASALIATMPTVPSVTDTHLSVPRADGTSIPVTRFTPEAAAGPQPAVLYIHAGGQIAGNVDMVRPDAAMLAERTGASFFAVGYRLAPEYLAPAGAEDCYAALEYVLSHAAELGIDPSRVVVQGTSGGGALAVAVALMARDRGLAPAIAKLVLVYPMLDDRTRLPAASPLHKFLMWSEHDNNLAWGAVLGDKVGRDDADVSPYAVPGRATDLSGLPPAYVDCGNLDLFLGEDVAFAGRLAAGGAEVEMHVWPGVPHMFEFAGVGLSRRAVEARVAAIRGV